MLLKHGQQEGLLFGCGIDVKGFVGLAHGVVAPVQKSVQQVVNVLVRQDSFAVNAK